MAWQLIYTSAPRSLEAGRSGFGTVARHRAITPLLASAIERISQFSRLPGTDADRVIFCHRIIAVGGGRFHVLSAIRDAGADYTGRTNHIAHHLIVEPREIAQLGASGSSPADVMLAMNWTRSWNEPPRYLEANEEVDLSAMRPQTTGSAWQRAAGSAEHAWLLAAGDASRGAYLITPSSTDLRAIFSESLRLMPERLWQISFTTSLQPSDEPADFRWIGIEAQSPLRSQSATSGRPVLDLSAPKTLPIPDVPQFSAAVQPIKEPEAEITIPTSENSPSRIDLRLPPIKIQPGTAPNYSYNKPKSAGRVHQQTKPASSSPLWLYVAGFLLLAIGFGFFFGWPAYQKYAQRKIACDAIDKALESRESSFPNVAKELKEAVEKVNDPAGIDIAKELAESANKSWQAASKYDFDFMLKLPDNELFKKAKSVGVNIPKEISEFEHLLHDIAEKNKQLLDFKSEEAQDFFALKALEDSTRDLTNKLKDSSFDKLKETVFLLSGKKRAATAQSLFTRNKQIESIRDEIQEKCFLQRDGEIKEMVMQIGILLDEWKYVKNQKPESVDDLRKNRPKWPEWLAEEAKKRTTKATSEKSNLEKKDVVPVAVVETKSTPNVKPSTRIKLYVFAENKNLLLPLPQSEKPLKFFLKSQEDKSEEELKYFGPVDPKAKQDNRSLGPDGRFFKLEGGNLKISSNPPSIPYTLIVKQGDVEFARVIIGEPKHNKSALEGIGIDLKLNPNGKIDGNLPELAGTDATLNFKLKSSIKLNGIEETDLEVNDNGECLLDSIRDKLKERVKSFDLAGKVSPAGQKIQPPPSSKRVGELATQLANTEFPVSLFGNPKDKKGKIKPYISLLGPASALAASDSDYQKSIDASNALHEAVGILRGNLNARDPAKDPLGHLSGECLRLITDLGIYNKNVITPLKIQEEAARSASGNAAALRELPFFKERKLPPGNYALYIKHTSFSPVAMELSTFKIP